MHRARGTTALPVLGLVADDLTGAADSAAGLAEHGWRATLHLGAVHLTADRREAPTVLAVSTRSRALRDDDAAGVTGAAVDALVAAGAERLYLKIDSTLRGSVAGQITGALTAWSHRYPGAAAVICPAFPSLGRTVVAGTLRVNGVPVGETPAATDPVTPRVVSDLACIIPGAVLGEPGTRARRLIVDATTDADLNHLAMQLVAGGPELIMVGSGGLAAALGRAWSPGEPHRPTPPADGPILVAVSSLHPATADQLDQLVAAVDVDVLTTGTAFTRPAAAAEKLAQRVAASLAERRYGALVIVGGDGAAAVLAGLCADRIDIDGALALGCPTGILRAGAADGLRLVTKSGGFGGRDTLAAIITRLRAGSRPDRDGAAPRR